MAKTMLLENNRHGKSFQFHCLLETNKRIMLLFRVSYGPLGITLAHMTVGYASLLDFNYKTWATIRNKTVKLVHELCTGNNL